MSRIRISALLLTIFMLRANALVPDEAVMDAEIMRQHMVKSYQSDIYRRQAVEARRRKEVERAMRMDYHEYRRHEKGEQATLDKEGGGGQSRSKIAGTGFTIPLWQQCAIVAALFLVLAVFPRILTKMKESSEQRNDSCL